ncbi:hypothetical protein ABMA27_005645 [Loxostege sticticalis]|uniref:Secreted protein n=1 Tax=Loxostege sticticalis TaxID=481309 RepID=A0ABR3HJZ7_LOXSC
MKQYLHLFNSGLLLLRLIGSRMTYLCHSCWARADRAAPHFTPRTSTPSAPQIQAEPSAVLSLVQRQSGYYCNCLVGNRTVGCCCHTMSIIWCLSWARY